MKDEKEAIDCALKVIDKIEGLRSNQELMGKMRSLREPEDTHIPVIPKDFDFPDALISICAEGLGTSLVECLKYTLNEEIRLGRRLTPGELKSISDMFLEEHGRHKSEEWKYGDFIW